MGSLTCRFGIALSAAMLAVASAFGAATAKPEPTVVDTSDAAGAVFDSSLPHSSLYPAAKAFDGKWADMYNQSTYSSDCWIAKMTNDYPVAYVVYKFNTATLVDGLRIHNSTEWAPTTRAPKDWTFEASNDGENWTVLDTRSGETGWVADQIRDYGFVNKTAYEYYKFNCTANNGDAAMMAIMELQFLQGGVADLTATSAGSVTASSSPYSTYVADKAFDGIKSGNSNGRWLAEKADDMYVVYKFNEPTRVNAISITTPHKDFGWGTSNRAPKDWTFLGSYDGTSWTLLDTQAGESGWSESGEERYYEFVNNRSYQYYKYDCTANNSANDVLQIMEIEFYYHNLGTPVLDDFSLTRVDATSYTVSATLLVNDAAAIYCLVNDGTTVTTNTLGTSVLEGQTVSGTVSLPAADTTYVVSVLAVNAAGETVEELWSAYTGTLTLGAVVNASEATLAPGTVAVSRTNPDPVPLTVYYTITGTVGADGVTWETPVGVTIPAGETTGYLLVKPLVDISVGEDIEVTVSLAPGNYDIPATGNSATVAIVNNDTPAGWEVMVITNAYDNPAGGFFSAPYGSALSNETDRIIRFVRPEVAEDGLRGFTQFSGSEWTTVALGENSVTRDHMLSFAGSKPTAAATVSSVACATQEGKITGLGAKCYSYTYTGSWYVPADGTYSFRLHMGYAALFSLDGKPVLRQATANAVTTNGVPLTAGWHSFYASFVTDGSGNIGPASGETLGFSFSSADAELTQASPGSAFIAANGYRFTQAFGAVLVPSMWAKGGDVVIDCSNVPGDLRVMGQLASAEHVFRFVNLPAGRSIEVGRPVSSTLTGWQDLTGCAYLDWTRTVLPEGVIVRFEGSVAIDRTWASAGRSVFSLGKNAILFVDTPNFFGVLTDEFHYPNGLYALHVGRPDVLGDTAKVFVPSSCGFGFGGAPFTLSSGGKLPVTRVASTQFTFHNDVDLADGAVINKTLTSGIGDKFMGEVYGPQGGARITGYASYMTFNGPVNVKESQTQQIGCRTIFAPAAGSDPSSVSGTLYLGSGWSSANGGNEVKPNKKSGWDYGPPTFCYCPEGPDAHPLSVGTLHSNTGAQFCPENVGPNSWGQFTHNPRSGANISTCSNNTINVGKLTGLGIHLRVGVPIPKTQAYDDRLYEDGFGPANFVFGEISGSSQLATVPVFVSSNVNITVTNITKATEFHYEVMTNGVNEAVLDIEGTVAEGTTITATDIAMLPARIKGFTGNITLTDTTEGRTYDVVYDFDRGVAIGGCDGSGNLAAAPATGTINLTFTGTPRKGRFGVVKFDSVADGVSLAGWTVNAPAKYGSYSISIAQGASGITFGTHAPLMIMVR